MLRINLITIFDYAAEFGYVFVN